MLLEGQLSRSVLTKPLFLLLPPWVRMALQDICTECGGLCLALCACGGGPESPEQPCAKSSDRSSGATRLPLPTPTVLHSNREISVLADNSSRETSALEDMLGAFQEAAVPGWLRSALVPGERKVLGSERLSNTCPHSWCCASALLPSTVDPCFGSIAQQWTLATKFRPEFPNSACSKPTVNAEPHEDQNYSDYLMHHLTPTAFSSSPLYSSEVAYCSLEAKVKHQG